MVENTFVIHRNVSQERNLKQRAVIHTASDYQIGALVDSEFLKRIVLSLATPFTQTLRSISQCPDEWLAN